MTDPHAAGHRDCTCGPNPLPGCYKTCSTCGVVLPCHAHPEEGSQPTSSTKPLWVRGAERLMSCVADGSIGHALHCNYARRATSATAGSLNFVPRLPR